MMSRIAPRVARTSFVSAAGGNWKCIPRSVPFRLLKAMLACAISGFRPCSVNSCWQNDRAKNPRLSWCASMSMMNAPASFVASKIMFSLPSRGDRIVNPPQIRSKVARAEQRLQLIDPAVARPFEVFDLEPDVLVSLVQLPCAFARIPFGSERRQDPRDLAEVRAVIAQIRSRALGEGDLAVGHGLVHDLGDLAYAVVLVVAADVEGLRAHKVFRRRQHRQRSEEHTSELQSQFHLVCRLLLEKKKILIKHHTHKKKNKN